MLKRNQFLNKNKKEYIETLFDSWVNETMIHSSVGISERNKHFINLLKNDKTIILEVVKYKLDEFKFNSIILLFEIVTPIPFSIDDSEMGDLDIIIKKWKIFFEQKR